MFVRGGSRAEALLGAVALVLAILGLATLLPRPLDTVATLVVGAALLLNAGALTTPLKALVALILGILSLLGLSPLTLNLIAILAMGFVALLTGATLGGRMLSIVRH